MFEWVKDQSLPEMVAAVSEGFCFRCSGRLTQVAPFDLDDPDPIEGQFAQGGCLVCRHWLRAGADVENNRDWFSVIVLNTKEGDLEGAILTLTLDPPNRDDEDEDHYDDEEW